MAWEIIQDFFFLLLFEKKNDSELHMHFTQLKKKELKPKQSTIGLFKHVIVLINLHKEK